LVAPPACTGTGTLYGDFQLLQLYQEAATDVQQFVISGGLAICASWYCEDKVSVLHSIIISKLEIQSILEHFIIQYPVVKSTFQIKIQVAYVLSVNTDRIYTRFRMYLLCYGYEE
jgi:hypothetical protein